VTDECRPYTLIAELTYRCPLRCAYCSNPTTRDAREELDASTWERVFREAAALGVVQLHLSGGEPLVRPDLEALVASGRASALYVNLITSGVPLARERLVRLKEAGLDAIQVSIQGTDPATNAWVAGKDHLAQKLAVAEWARELALPLTLNVVLHRRNIDDVARYIELADALGAHRVELANTQYLGFALDNRDALLPSRAQVARAREVAAEARQRLSGKLEILFVLPDYHRERPRPCMNGWGRSFILVDPNGTALPCHQAASITTLSFENVRSRPLSAIWNDSPAFSAFRGEAWMREPCRSCDRRAVDFGGCRCQAFQLLGDARHTDPVCQLSPEHERVMRAVNSAEHERSGTVRYRTLPLLRT
jgi:pyrroloquinoline quinone biosynthesis protein E